MARKQLSVWKQVKMLIAWVVSVASGVLTFGYGLQNYIGFSERFEYILANYEFALHVIGNLISKIPLASASPATLNTYAIILGMVFIAKGVMTPLNNSIAKRFEKLAETGKFDFQREAAAKMANSLKSTGRFFWSLVMILLVLFFVSFFFVGGVQKAVSPLILIRMAFWSPIALLSIIFIQSSFSKGRGFSREILSVFPAYYVALGTIFLFLTTFVAPETGFAGALIDLIRLMIPSDF